MIPTSGVSQYLSRGGVLQVENTITKSGSGHESKTFPSLHSKLE